MEFFAILKLIFEWFLRFLGFEAVDEAGALLPEAISPGASATLTSEFSTGK